MAAEKIITCLFILVLFAAFISFAQANQDSNHETVPTGKELVNGANKNWQIRGRKMVQMKKLKDVKMRGSTATESSRCGGNGDHQSGFLDFNVDYHSPRHHPPKNN
ncbi:Tetratricopeptide repeat-like superfamily protein, putative isoform 1 [Hibiscus syriacus]|uniref:Tetratricopeptide repeat-like superfamily protein, putative isoform 1 n=1 Tax=Hibiscus syriacus TaxID=106335 RepID=A0A6A3A427_HIBSY|nr:root meristem growth factor 2 [Hibiscus syriacus]KAE8699044.1 Tetratricopeptide repeat-like superfamily protein, putative isoform 1 [Hibiscus syriacus]